MRRWPAYSGTPIRLDELVYKPRCSLIGQSAHSRLGVETTKASDSSVGPPASRDR